MTDAVKSPSRQVQRPMQLNLEAHYTQRYAIFVPATTTMDDVLQPGWWAHVAKKLRPCDEVKIIPEDMAWRAVVFVRAVGRVEAIVQMIEFTEIGGHEAIAAADAPYYAKYGSPSVMFRVHRRDNNEVVKDHFQTREQAERWILNHVKAAA